MIICTILKNHLYRYKLERAYELICYMILNKPVNNQADKYRREGLEQARRILQEFLDGNDHDQIIRKFINKLSDEVRSLKNQTNRV